MWTAEIKINGEKALIGSKTKKFNVFVSAYPVQFYKKKNSIYVYFAGFVYGENKDKFLKELKKDKKVVNLEISDDFFVCIIKEPIKFERVYSHKIIHIEPLIINEKAIETWAIGSFDKEVITKFIKILEKTHNAELIKIQNKKIKNISIIGIQPNLTERQKQALELAIKHGYYEHPRKTDLTTLAKKMNIYYSAFQRHLRVAEKKLITSSYKMIK